MNKEKYLKEDQDILDQLDKERGMAVTSQIEVSKLHIRATLRNRKSLEDLNKATQKFSILLFTVAILQLLLGLFQFGFSSLVSDNKWLGIFLLLVFVGVMYWLIKKSEK